jgi:hypothetical protein
MVMFAIIGLLLWLLLEVGPLLFVKKNGKRSVRGIEIYVLAISVITVFMIILSIRNVLVS